MIMEYKAIDLGLPSGRLWADKNVGAEKETDYGLYFQWGDTIRYTDASHSTWATCPGNGSNSDYNGVSIEAWDAENLQSVNGMEDSTLKIEADAATVNMGSKWRMPTVKEGVELWENTNYEVAEINGVKGGKFISKTDASKYIFLPFAGAAVNGSFEGQELGPFNWSNSTSNHADAYLVAFDENGFIDGAFHRCFALPVRGVC